MIDIVSHRSRIGQFNAMKHRKCTQTRRTIFHTHLKILIALILMITVLTAIVASLIEIPALGQHIIALPALQQQSAANTSFILLCAPPAYWGHQSGPNIITQFEELIQPAGSTISPLRSDRRLVGVEQEGATPERRFSKHCVTPTYWGHQSGPNAITLFEELIQPAGSRISPLRSDGRLVRVEREGATPERRSGSDSGASYLRSSVSSGALSKHCVTPTYWGFQPGPNEIVNSEELIQPAGSQIYTLRQPAEVNPLPPWTCPGEEHWKRNKEMRMKNGNRASRGIKIAHWNLGSAELQNKMCEIEAAVEKVKPGIFGISEANLSKNTDLKLVQLEGYKLLTAKTLKNPNIGMSRVVVYLSETLAGKLREDLMSEDFSSIWVELGVPGSKKILVSNVYRDHQWMNQGVDKTSKSPQAVMERWMGFLDQWKRALETGSEVHSIGDFNIDSQTLLTSKGPQKQLADRLVKEIVPLGVTQCAPGATWTPQGSQRGQKSGLDHHWTNRPDKLSEVEAHTIGKSDHKLITAVRYAKLLKMGERFVRKRSYKNFDESRFLWEVGKISWWQVYKSENVDEAVEIFTKNLTRILDRRDMAPIKTFQSRHHYASWLSQETKEMMEKRDKAIKKYSETRKPQDWEEAKALRNKVIRRLKTEKMRNMREKIAKCEKEKDCGKVWKNIKSYLSWGGSTGAPSKLTNNAGQLITSPAEMAELQNKYYVEKVKKIRQKLPEIGDPTAQLRKSMEERPHPRTEELRLRTVNPSEVDKLLKKLRNSKSCGLDNIDTYVLKLTRPYIVPSLTHIINLSISTHTFPKAYKVAKVVPLYKGKDSDATAPKSYRPVALLPVVSKVLERVVQKQIAEYMDKNQFWHPQHHAYRAHHSTTTAMISMHDSWVEAAEKGYLAGIALIDMSAAFDVVDTKILLKKCKLFNFGSDAENWLRSYLTERSQCTHISGSTSKILSLEAGVPQGSVLGPSLYTLFTSDFPEVVHQSDCPHKTSGGEQFVTNRTMCEECGGLVCFADDSTYTVTARHEQELSEKLSEKFQVMSTYLTENRLCINTDKTHMMVLCTEQKRRHIDTTSVTLDTGQEIIHPTPVELLLGYRVHQNLGFENFLISGKDSVINSLTKRIGALKSIAKVSNFKTRLSVCSSLVISKILYMLPLYGGAPGYMLDAIQKKQCEAMRLVTRRKWEVKGRKMTSTRELLMQCNYLSVRQMAYFYSLATVHKALVHKTPEYIHQVLCKALESGVRHRYPTRAAGTRVVKEASLQVANTSFRWRASSQYAALPADLKAEQSIQAFLKRLKKHTIENISI